MNKILSHIIICVVAILTATPISLHAEVTKTDVSALDYAIYAIDAEAEPGQQVTLSICLKNQKPIATWNADLVLPEGVTIAKDNFGDPLVSLSTIRTSTQRHQVSTTTLPSGTVRILCGSQTNKTFSGIDGEVVTITLDVAATVTPGICPITLKTETIAEPTGVGYNVPLVISLLTIGGEDPSRFDHNGDGKVDIADVTMIVDYIKTHQDMEIKK